MEMIINKRVSYFVTPSQVKTPLYIKCAAFFCAGIFDDEAKEGEEKPTQKKRAGERPAR